MGIELQKYSTNSLPVSVLISQILSKQIAIPEIQRPFVWKAKQVRDLMDSLYKGYPTGYIIIWQNPNIKLKDGSLSVGKKIIIDGQQRITALMTAIAGLPIVNSDYKKCRIKIAFNPFAALSDDKDAEIFAVQDSSHLKSKKWIPDIAEIFQTGFNMFGFVREYCTNNPDMRDSDLGEILSKLLNIGNRQIGIIELSDTLEIDLVTDIFIRINSKGTSLSQGDFVMSKIAADEKFGGNQLRKAIDYFSHLAIEPSFYSTIKENDVDFARSDYFPKMEWLKDDLETVFDPDCDDVLRVAFMYKFKRAKLADLVGLLSGRDFKTRDYNESIVENTYK